LKKIIFCADGTWNGPEDKTGCSIFDALDRHGEVSSSDVTNVVKFFANLAGHVTPESLTLSSEQEKIFADGGGNVRQVAKYIHGVGDSSNPIVKFLGGAFGLGVIGRIVRGYTYISRNYVAGDEIHITGFSRGAYTARALAGMIAKVGLLNPQSYDPTNKNEAYRLGMAAWAKSKSVSLDGANRLTSLAGHMLNFVENIVAKQLPANGLIPNIPIKSVAVWDTVGSLGIPEYVDDKRYDLFRFVDNALSDKVEYGFHAMSIDEMRRDFPVTKWNDRKNIRQVWFVGAHSDVGGGYPFPQSRLSDEALGWMMKNLSSLGVEFGAPLVNAPDGQVMGQPIHTPWEMFPFADLPTSARQVDAKDTLHVSVIRRWGADLAYRPQSMAAFNQQGVGGFKVDEVRYP